MKQVLKIMFEVILRSSASSKILWCPLTICLTCSLPSIGILEALLLRLCEILATRNQTNNIEAATSKVRNVIVDLIANFPSVSLGLINCSFSFLLSSDSDRLHFTLAPENTLPALPHGISVTSVCRLLGAEGLTALLVAVLTECKILIHSAYVANLVMVAEVITSLAYSFQWHLTYVPVLPLSMNA